MVEVHGAIRQAIVSVVGEVAATHPQPQQGPPLPPLGCAQQQSHSSPSPFVDPPPPGHHNDLTEANFLRLLGQLQVIDKIGEDSAKMLWSSLRPFGAAELIKRLEGAEAEVREAKRRQEE